MIFTVLPGSFKLPCNVSVDGMSFQRSFEFGSCLNLETCRSCLDPCLGSSHWFMRRSCVVSLVTPLSLSLSHDVYKCSNVRSITHSQYQSTGNWRRRSSRSGGMQARVRSPSVILSYSYQYRLHVMDLNPVCLRLPSAVFLRRGLLY